jgi:hypothetical protein
VPTLPFSIEASTSSDIFEGDLVQPLADGSVIACTAVTNALILGVFTGCEFTNADGQRVWSNKYTQTITGEDTVAYVTCDPFQLYKVAISDSDVNTTLTRADIFLNYDIEYNTGNSTSGLSGMTLDSGTTGVTTAAQVRLVGLVNQDTGQQAAGTVETATYSHGIVMIDPLVSYWLNSAGI